MLEESNKLTKMYTNTLTRTVNDVESSTKILFNNWKKKLFEFENIESEYQLKLYQKSLNRQMELKDYLIKKIQNELEEFIEYRNRAFWDNSKLIDNTLNSFKKEIEEIRNQYHIHIEGMLPKDLAMMDVRINENNNYWKILKYYKNMIQKQTRIKNTKIKNIHNEKMDQENGRLELLIEKCRLKDINDYRNMKDSYDFIMDDYKKKTLLLNEDYLEYREKDERFIILQKKLNSYNTNLLNTIDHLKKEFKELKSLNDVNMLIKKRDEIQKNLPVIIRKVKHDSEWKLKSQLFLLSEIVKKEFNDMDDMLKKGYDIIRYICQCQELEKSN